jgi:polysaccharide biosynthesis/export protein
MTAASIRFRAVGLLCCVLLAPTAAGAAGQAPLPAAPPSAPGPAAAPSQAEAGVTPPADYVVGPEDVLGIVIWRERELSGDVIVRPDGKISLPLLNDIDVAGLTPDQVRERITERAKEFVEGPTATVVVKQIHSRKVFITGSVERPGPFPLMQQTSVLQLISLAGGLREFANASSIVVVRNENGRQVTFAFNYNDVKNGRKLEQNIILKPGDTVIVP